MFEYILSRYFNDYRNDRTYLHIQSIKNEFLSITQVLVTPILFCSTNRAPILAHYDGTYFVVPEWNSKGTVSMGQINWGNEVWTKEGFGNTSIFIID